MMLMDLISRLVGIHEVHNNFVVAWRLGGGVLWPCASGKWVNFPVHWKMKLSKAVELPVGFLVWHSDVGLYGTKWILFERAGGM